MTAVLNLSFNLEFGTQQEAFGSGVTLRSGQEIASFPFPNITLEPGDFLQVNATFDDPFIQTGRPGLRLTNLPEGTGQGLNQESIGVFFSYPGTNANGQPGPNNFLTNTSVTITDFAGDLNQTTFTDSFAANANLAAIAVADWTSTSVDIFALTATWENTTGENIIVQGFSDSARVTVTGGAGTEIIFVPEPSAYAAVFALGMFLIVCLRRSRA
ncbi:MAG: hypothetical protein AAGA45_00070 [Verrucomicrobiota bacterium]